MNKQSILKLAFGCIPLVVVSASYGTDYSWSGAGDNNLSNAANWAPNGASITSGSTVTPLAGDRLIINGGNINAGGVVNIGAGAELVQAATGQHVYSSQVQLAGTGTDGNGAFKNNGNDWANMTDVKVTGDATAFVNSGGWRHDSHGGAVNQFDLNGKTLTVRGGNNWYFVNTNVIGTGVLDVSIGGEFNFEANAVLPAGMTMRLSNNTRSSSWDGAGKIMSGDVQIVDRGILENRQNDGGKTYAGTISIGSQADHQLTLRVTTENGTSNNFMNVSGKVTGPGMLVRDGINTEKVFLQNPSNDYSGGTVINSGILVVGAQGALPANNINVNGGSIDLNGNSQSMTSGLLQGGTIVGAGSVLTMDGPGVKEIRPGANVSVPVELNGGVLRPDHRAGNNVLGNGLTGSMLVTGDSTLKPYQDPAQAAQPNRLHEYHRVGADLGTDDGVTGAIYSGAKDGIPAIDSTAKPFGDNNKWVYTGELINTTAGNLTVSFGEQYDDQIRVKVDGSTVLFDTGWNTATASGNAGQPGAVTLTPGAHSIEISSFDGVGGAGPNSQWDKGVGIREGSTYTLQGPTGDQGALSQADNAAFNKITSATLPAGLAISAPGIDNRADRSENKNIEIDPGVKLTVDTSDMQGKTYTLTGILSGGGSMIKAGSGTLALGGVSTYTGQTVVNQGTLKLLPGASLSPSSEITVAAGASVDASASGGITIPGGQTLDGNGSVIGNVIVAGELAPGNSIGQLTITGDLTLTGSSDFELDRNASPLNADNATVSGTLTYGGTLTLTNIGSPLVAGDTFNLFDAGTTTGSFSSITFPAGTTPADWINNLGTIGSLTYVPEPGSVGMGLLATAILLRRRRK